MALVKLNYFSRTLGMCMSLDVILPEKSQGIGVQTGDGWDGTEPLAALYLLHGTSDDQTIWQRRTSIERYVADKKLAVIMPTTHLGAYTNQQYGFRYFDYVAKEVPETCRTYFNLSSDREKNFVGGLSMGGYGALKIGMRCADSFGYAIGLSSGCDRLSMLAEKAKAFRSLSELETHRSEFTEGEYQQALLFFLNFGSPERYLASEEDNLFQIAESRTKQGLVMPKIWMVCGTEDFALKPNREFHAHLERLGVPHDYHEAPGIHDWLFWDTHIQEALEWLPL